LKTIKLKQVEALAERDRSNDCMRIRTSPKQKTTKIIKLQNKAIKKHFDFIFLQRNARWGSKSSAPNIGRKHGNSASASIRS
jgi:hypothetical protein